jgi:N-acetylglutamate synthase-like GNAT family acetyltransferase
MNAAIVAVAPGPAGDPAFWSADYRAERALRFRVLRAPLGMPPGSEENAYEWSCKHWVARVDGIVVGCVLLHVFDEHGARVGKLMQMAVEPRLQGQGLGAALVRCVWQAADADGLESVVLHARETAIPFYERLGCVIEGEPFTEVGLPHRRMRRVRAEVGRS